jgi:SAM-dependent methyltransferase
MTGTPYDAAFYRMQADASFRSAQAILPLVQKLLPVHSVCDVGCGVGTWLRAWRELGVEDVIGLDGDYVDQSMLVVPQAQFLARDLRQPIVVDRRFDLAMSMEVAEHLPPERSESFVADLVALAPVVLFSAAIPRQGGTDHRNERWQSYWAGLFAGHGYLACDVLRAAVWTDTTIEPWYRQNALVFCREDALPGLPALAQARGAPPALPLDLVHPEVFKLRLEAEDELPILSRKMYWAMRKTVARRRGG